MTEIDITTEELRMVILELCRQAAASGGDTKHMIELVERIAVLTDWYKGVIDPLPN